MQSFQPGEVSRPSRRASVQSRRLRFDRMQAEQLTTNLARAGFRPAEFAFSNAGANRLARLLYNALRDRALGLTDEEETRLEFLSTRLVETGPGTVKCFMQAQTPRRLIAFTWS